MPIGTALALASQLSELQTLVAQTHAQAKAEGATEEEAAEAAAQVKETIESVHETDKALAVAEAKAMAKVKQRQEALKKDKKDVVKEDSGSGTLPPVVDLGNPYDDLSSPVYEDIARDLRAEKLEILQAKIADLERQQPAAKDEEKPGFLSTAYTCVKETLTEQMAAVRADPWSYGAAVAEVIPGGVGTTATLGNAVSSVYRGEQSALSAVATLGVEGVLGFIGAKAITKGGKYLKSLVNTVTAKFAEKRGAKALSKTAQQETAKNLSGNSGK
jgi:flagellar biosynthesis GTPase FlhF